MTTQDKTQTVIVCRNTGEVPKKLHWAILENESVVEKEYGPSYPEETHNFLKYTAYLVKEEWEAEVKKRMVSPSHHLFTAIEVKPATTTVEITVNVSTD